MSATPTNAHNNKTRRTDHQQYGGGWFRHDEKCDGVGITGQCANVRDLPGKDIDRHEISGTELAENVSCIEVRRVEYPRFTEGHGVYTTTHAAIRSASQGWTDSSRARRRIERVQSACRTGRGEIKRSGQVKRQSSTPGL